MSATTRKPAVLFIADVCRLLRTSRATVDRLRRYGAFPIKELPSLDKRPRWARADVEAYLAGQTWTGRRRGVMRRA